MTPEERRQKAIERIRGTLMVWGVGGSLTAIAEAVVDDDLEWRDAHPDPNERALGQMLRYGVEPNGKAPHNASTHPKCWLITQPSNGEEEKKWEQ